MTCPACQKDSLASRLTSAGVVVDHCGSCNGVWFGQGEAFLFSNDPMRLHEALVHCFAESQPTERLCPHCHVTMHEGTISPLALKVDHCPKCIGLWFADARTLQETSKLFRLKLDRAVGPGRPTERHPKKTVRREAKVELKRRRPARVAAASAPLTPLPNLFLRAAGAMGFLYTLLALVLIALSELFDVPPHLVLYVGIGAAALQFLLGPLLMDLSLRWLYKCSWISPEQLPQHLREFVQRVTKAHGMRFPRFGLIVDGAPNAFTYGHTPGNARIVVTQGLLDLLDESEVEAVVAHEIGHAKHWDMLLMTVAALVPLLLYYLFRSIMNATSRMPKRKGGRASGQARGTVYLVAAGAYVAYIVAQYVVLWFSRTREFYADRFSGRVTENPNTLASALVKIAYGLAGRTPGDEEEAKRSGQLEAVGALGVFDPGAARALAVSAYGLTAQAAQHGAEDDATIEAMKWDLWNPWAKWYELHSTHPLVANRLHYLGEQAAALGWEPYVVFDREKPESYWDEFLVDFLLYVLPPVAAIGAAVGGYVAGDHRLWLGVGLFALGYAGLLRVAFRYKGKAFPPMNVAGLLRKVKVSAMRSVPVTLRGRIIGKGVPGLIWSEDFVMQDDTGILLLDYNQPLAIWEWFFGLLKAGEYAGRDIEATGWYRRSPIPYMEIKTITCDGATRRCYALQGKVVTCLVLMIAGVAMVGPTMLALL